MNALQGLNTGALIATGNVDTLLLECLRLQIGVADILNVPLEALWIFQLVLGRQPVPTFVGP